MDSQQRNIFQLPHKPFLSHSVSENTAAAEASPGAHQKLIRQTDGRYMLIVREASGIIRRLPVMVFEGSFIA